MTRRKGWYRDPYGDELRWWDGAGWTDWVVDDPGELSAPEMPEAPEMPTAPPVPTSAQMPSRHVDEQTAADRLVERQRAERDARLDAKAATRDEVLRRMNAARTAERSNAPVSTAPANRTVVTSSASSLDPFDLAAELAANQSTARLAQQRSRSGQSTPRAAAPPSPPPPPASFQYPAPAGVGATASGRAWAGRGATPNAAPSAQTPRNVAGCFVFVLVALLGMGSCVASIIGDSTSSPRGSSSSPTTLYPIDEGFPPSLPAWQTEVARACADVLSDRSLHSAEVAQWSDEFGDFDVWFSELVNDVDRCATSPTPPTTDLEQCGTVDTVALTNGPGRYLGHCVAMSVLVTAVADDPCYFRGVWDDGARATQQEYRAVEASLWLDDGDASCAATAALAEGDRINVVANIDGGFSLQQQLGRPQMSAMFSIVSVTPE